MEHDKIKIIDDVLERFEVIKKAIEAQANDETLWCQKPSIGEEYMQQSLRWLHDVIESGDGSALSAIIDQSNGDI